MVGIPQAKCPQCGHIGLYLGTEDWKPYKIKCNRRLCGWEVDLKQYWPNQKDYIEEAKEIVRKANR